MKVFLSYASTHKDLVGPVCTTLRASGFEVFFDKSDLPPAQTYDDPIREAVGRCDLFVFVLSPEAVKPGRYTLTELLFAQQRWPNPAGHVLVVLPLDTPEPRLPEYLRPLTLQKQVGNLEAEVLATLRRMQEALAVADEAAAGARTAVQEEDRFASVNLCFATGTPHGYTLRLDGAARAEASLPRDADPNTIEQWLWEDAREMQDTARRDTGAEGTLFARMPSQEAVRRVGSQLHRWLFAPEFREVLRDPLRRIDRQRGQGLRFVIDTSAAPELARLPWEFAFDAQRQDFVFTDPMKPLVRWLDIDESVPTLEVQPPLRLLIAVAAPRDRPELAVGEELARLDRVFADLQREGLLQTALLPHASVERLDRQLLDFAPHVLHFIGHGDFDGDEGRLLLESHRDGLNDDAQEASNAAPLTGRRLAVLLRNHLKTLRLVYLNSCLSAAVSRRDPFGGVAQALIGHGVPAVIAMQFPIPDRSAARLAHDFYRYLASGRPVDEALSAARALVVARGGEIEWGAPVLTMRSPDGRLFDFGAALPPQRRRPPSSAPDGPGQVVEPQATRAKPSIVRRAATLAGLGLSLGAMLFLSLNAPETSSPSEVAQAPSLPLGSAGATLPGQSVIDQARVRLYAGDATGALDLLERAHAASTLPMFDRMSLSQRNDLMQLLQQIIQTTDGDPLAHARVIELARALGLEGPTVVERGTSRPSSGPGPFEEIVRSGDTLWSIARRRYGDPLRWREIFEANQVRIADPSHIKPGQVLNIPPHPLTANASVHVVKPGESLWAVAARMYGNGALWPQLYEANAARIGDPKKVQVGLELRVPAAR